LYAISRGLPDLLGFALNFSAPKKTTSAANQQANDSSNYT
jgi:hypothetical protein